MIVQNITWVEASHPMDVCWIPIYVVIIEWTSRNVPEMSSLSHK